MYIVLKVTSIPTWIHSIACHQSRVQLRRRPHCSAHSPSPRLPFAQTVFGGSHLQQLQIIEHIHQTNYTESRTISWAVTCPSSFLRRRVDLEIQMFGFATPLVHWHEHPRGSLASEAQKCQRMLAIQPYFSV